MCKEYGYCRKSQQKQNIERQIRNIKAEYPNAIIIQEAYTGTTIDRKEWNKLYKAVKAGDTIEIREKSKNIQRFKDIKETTAGRLVPEWLEADLENLQGTVKELPTRDMIDVPVDEMLIVELYSK